MQLKSFSLAPALVLAVVLVSGCSSKTAPEEPIRAVKIMTVGMGQMQSGLEFSGEVRPQVESRLGFRVAGKIVQRWVESGQKVKAGQVLMQLDPQDYKLSAEAARAQLAAAQTNRDLAAADLKRFGELREQNFISGAELERRESTLKAAQAQLEQAQAQLAGQTNQAGYTTLVADAPGIVTGVDAETGQVVAAGSPVIRIARDGLRDVVFSVPEDKIMMFKAGTPVEVKPWGKSEAVTATVREIAGSADPVTRTFLVKAGLTQTDAMPLGSTVSARPKALDNRSESVIKLPTTAIRQDGGKTAVWVLDSTTMTIQSQSVEVATADGNEVVIRSGLIPGKQVVVAGVHVLTAGQKVTVYQPRTAASDKSQAVN